MPVAKRTVVTLGALGAFLAIGGVLLAQGANKSGLPDTLASIEDTATIECTGSIVELRFDPEGRIDIRLGGKTIASADAVRRGLNYGACAQVHTQTGWATVVRYALARKRTTITCRFPGRFFVHVDPVSPSWAGERPAGSAVYLVLGKRVKPGPGPQKTILASAAVLERPKESTLNFARRYCAPA